MVLSRPDPLRWTLRVLRGALLAVLALPAVAQTAAPPITAVDGGLAADLGGHHMVFPAPVWTVPSAEPVAQAQTRYTALAPGVDSLVLLPMDASVVTWTELMGILAVHRPGYTAETQLASVVDPISEVCASGQLYASTLGVKEDGAVLLLCGRYRPGADVPARCGGGIILATVLQSPQGAAKVYHEWCTSTFDAEDHETWPIPEPDLERYAEILIAVSTFEPLAPAN